MMAVGACAMEYLSAPSTKGIMMRLIDWMGMSCEKVIHTFAYVAAMHDIGKAHPDFQPYPGDATKKESDFRHEQFGAIYLNLFRIKAHFLIRYTALLVYKLLECKLADQNTPVATSNLIATLKNMNVANIHDVEYMALYEGSKTLDALVSLTGLDWDRMHYRPKDLLNNYCLIMQYVV